MCRSQLASTDASSLPKPKSRRVSVRLRPLDLLYVLYLPIVVVVVVVGCVDQVARQGGANDKASIAITCSGVEEIVLPCNINEGVVVKIGVFQQACNKATDPGAGFAYVAVMAVVPLVRSIEAPLR